MTLAHGGNVYETADSLGCRPEDLLDYSASINPLGPPPGLLEHFSAHFGRLEHYPDIHNRAIIRALAAHHRVAADRIVVGNGSTELIYALPRALGVDRVLAALPTFSEYRRAFQLQGVASVDCVCRADTDFQPTIEHLAELTAKQRPQAILVTHPGSPSGTLLSESVIQWLLETCRRQGIICVVDEVFADFCEAASLKQYLDTLPNLVLIRSMTKFFGIPGLRLGYLITKPDLAARVGALLPPWSVNTLAQLAGVYCLAQHDYQAETLELVATERQRMVQDLSRLPGFHIFPGRANYLLARLADWLPDARDLQRDLLDRERILIRDCASFDGLSRRDFRLAVRRPDQNDRLLAALTAWCRRVAAE